MLAVVLSARGAGRSLALGLILSMVAASSGAMVLVGAGPAANGVVGATATDAGLALGYEAVGAPGSEIRTLDLSSASNPTLLGSSADLWSPVSMVAEGGLLYLLSGDDLVVVDPADANALVEVGRVTVGPNYRLTTDGSHVYVGTSGTVTPVGVHVVDIANPAAPVAVGFVQTQAYPIGLAVRGANLYLAEWLGGVERVDVSNPASPAVVAHFSNGDRFESVAVTATRLWAKGWSLGELCMLDPLTLVHRSCLPFSGDSVVASGETAFLASSFRVMALEATTLRQVVTRSELLTRRARGPLSQVGGNLVVGGGQTVFDPDPIDRPAQIASFAAAGAVSDVFVEGNYAYAVGDQFTILDVSNPAAPVELASLPVQGDDIEVAGGYAYTNGRSGAAQFSVIDVRDALAPAVLHSERLQANDDLEVDGSRVFAVGNAALQILDVSTPAVPVHLGVAYAQAPLDANSVAVRGGRAYVGKSRFDPNLCPPAQYTECTSIEVYDVAGAGAPILLGATPLEGWGSVRDIALVGNLLYATSSNGAVRIFDITTEIPTFLRWEKTAISNVTDLELQGDDLWYATSSRSSLAAGVYLTRGATSGQWDELGGVPGAASGVDVVGTRVFVAAGAPGLRIFEMGSEYTPPGPQVDIRIETLRKRARYPFGPLLRVTILGSDTVNVRTIKRASLLVGPDEASPHRRIRSRPRDRTGDGVPDLRWTVSREDAGVDREDETACIVGAFEDGSPFGACAPIEHAAAARFRARAAR